MSFTVAVGSTQYIKDRFMKMDYSKYLNKVARDLPPSGIRKFFDIVATMPEAISLGVGEPDFATPATIAKAGMDSIKIGKTQYTSNAGLYELRAEISKFLAKRYNVNYSSEEIIITVGGSEGMDIALRALINPGDEVLIADPSYVSYAPGVRLCGGIPIPVSSSAKDKFKLTVENFRKAITPKTKLLLMSFPSNPTGAIMEEEDLRELVEEIKKTDIVVITDEIYAELTYGKKHCSIASFEGMRDRTVYISGFSKAFAMTGWRMGYVAGPQELLDIMLKIHQYVIMCAPTAGQYAALAGLEEGFTNNFIEIEKMRDEYNVRRRFVVDRLNAMGLECFEPEGAFYCFPSVASTGLDGEEFAGRLLNEHKVAVVPGGAFGQFGNDHVRISYAYSMEKLNTALDKIEIFVNSLK